MLVLGFLPQQLRQLRHVGRNPPRLVAADRRLGPRHLLPHILQVLVQYRRIDWLGGSWAMLYWLYYFRLRDFERFGGCSDRQHCKHETQHNKSGHQ